jgi:acetyltransferase-like isoleucine patch superfamily enzyme
MRKKRLKIEYPSYIKNCQFGLYNTIHNNILVDTKLGDFSYIAKNTEVYNAKIGKFSSIGPDCKIGLSIHPVKDFVSLHPAFYSTCRQFQKSFSDKKYFNDDIKETSIGNDVWIGANVLIAGGVKIGHGAIVGMGAVVVKDVPPYSIVGGVPAKIIRFRFNSDQIEQLLKIQWWDIPTEMLKKQFKEFHNINNFLKVFK